MELKSLIITIVICLTSMEHVVSAENIELSFDKGRVTIITSEIPLDKILIEWARLGNTNFINADSISSRLISVTLIDVEEAKALEVLLREVAGYLFAPRPLRKTGLSIYDRVFLMSPDNVSTLGFPPQDQSTEEPSSSNAQLESVEDIEQEGFDDLELLEQLSNRRNNSGVYNENILDFPTFLPMNANQDAENQPRLSSRPGVIVNTEEGSSRPRRRRP